MRNALALGLFVVLGVAFVSSAQLSGEWYTSLKLDLDPFGPYEIPSGWQEPFFYSVLDIQYLVGDWTFAAAAEISTTQVNTMKFTYYDVWFEAYGSLGPFSSWSLLALSTSSFQGSQQPVWEVFQSGAALTIGGVDTYALFALLALSDMGIPPLIGSALGAIGTAGDCRLGAEISFSLSARSSLWQVFRYGFEGAIVDWDHRPCNRLWSPGWYTGNQYVMPVAFGCDVVFTRFSGIAEIPTSCADIYVGIMFDCEGFDFLSFFAEDIDIGLDWLKIYGLSITYYVDEKDFASWFQIVTVDTVCVTPYLTVVEGEGASVTGITLNALTASWALGDCEVYWGHIFEEVMMEYDGFTMWPTHGWAGPHPTLFGFGPLGADLLSYYSRGSCLWRVDAPLPYHSYLPNEVFGFRCAEDSCCGGLSSVGVSGFFLTELPEDAPAGLTGILGWLGSYLELSVGVGSNVNLIGAMDITAFGGIEFVAFGVEVAW